MTDANDNFQKWFVAPLRLLNADGHAAFAVLMIAFPLLERYLRQKSGTHEANLGDAFFDEFHNIFKVPSRDLVPRLWQCYRNGLLHQATFSKRTRGGQVMPDSFITCGVDLIEYDAQCGAFFVNPKAFSERIINEIQKYQ